MFLSWCKPHDSYFLCVQSSSYPAAVCASDQDSGVEDEDLSPRPSPSPHLPAQQVSVMMGSGLLFSVDRVIKRSQMVVPLPKNKTTIVTESIFE